MNTHLQKIYFLAVFFIAFTACKNDDEEYVPIEINAEADLNLEVFQDEVLTIAIFDNDNNIPQMGTIEISGVQSGSVQVLDPNNTPLNLLDDVLAYTPSSTYNLSDTFEYTVCDQEGLSCDTAQVSIKIFKSININLGSLPFEKLSDYNFFYGDLVNHEAVPGVLPYEPISTLFTDYAHKKRYVWMPKGTSSEYVGDGDLLNFPLGTIIIKSFFYDNVLPNNLTKYIETRFLIKKAEGWVFADYIWDESQQEAILNASGEGFNVPIGWIQDGEEKFVNYRVPSNTECLLCHTRFGDAVPIGPKPQNLNANYEFADGSFNQLQKWIQEGYLLSNIPSNIETVIDWKDTSQDLEKRVRSYIDINCAHCHIEGGYCAARPITLSYNATSDFSNLGVCVTPDLPVPGLNNETIIDPGNAQNSIFYFRMQTQEPEYVMPFIGRSLAHDEFLVILEEWINTLEIECD